MSSIQDVPNLLVTAGVGILAIPNKLNVETKQVLQQFVSRMDVARALGMFKS